MPYAKEKSPDFAKEKSPDFYRRLAHQCREAARTVSEENERAELLVRAKTWDFLADHAPAASSELK
jgi:hypothetical protein